MQNWNGRWLLFRKGWQTEQAILNFYNTNKWKYCTQKWDGSATNLLFWRKPWFRGLVGSRTRRSTFGPYLVQGVMVAAFWASSIEPIVWKMESADQIWEACRLPDNVTRWLRHINIFLQISMAEENYQKLTLISTDTTTGSVLSKASAYCSYTQESCSIAFFRRFKSHALRYPKLPGRREPQSWWSQRLQALWSAGQDMQPDEGEGDWAEFKDSESRRAKPTKHGPAKTAGRDDRTRQ